MPFKPVSEACSSIERSAVLSKYPFIILNPPITAAIGNAINPAPSAPIEPTRPAAPPIEPPPILLINPLTTPPKLLSCPEKIPVLLRASMIELE
ncbi:MAG: hypothetical protein BWY19_01218 [bacterium ADurb.Bin212]|nr:MAG: hypothetical protein BWY19_01218 [bacterium ADurb.Bin212]